MTLLPLIILCALLALAVWNDLRTRRIPNAVVFGGAVLGLLFNTALPSGDGLFIQVFGGIGFLSALAGAGPVCCCRCTRCARWAPATSS
jgi:prepilin peptidase CpaA